MLKVRGVHKKFDSDKVKWALKGVSFKADKGKHIFIIGETGSGKSTMLKCIYGLYNLDKGRVSWNSEVVLGPADQLVPGNENMRLVEQEYRLSGFKTVEQNFEEALPFGLYKKEQKSRINDMLDLFQLKGLSRRKPHELSGGQQQRVAIAKAFINLPDILLLDEPFAHFDPQMRNRVFEFLKERIESEGLLVITVTHDYNETLKNADHVIVLEKGKIVQSATAEDLYASPCNLYSAGLLGEYNIVKDKRNKLFVRPEEIKIIKTGKYKGVVKKIRFCGHFYELALIHGNEEVVVFIPVDHNIEIGQELAFNIPEKVSKVNDTDQISAFR